jgi:AhpC/TSA family
MPRRADPRRRCRPQRGRRGEPARALDEATQLAIADAIAAAIDASKDPGIGGLIKLRERARRELKVVPAEPPRFFDPAVYAPAQGARSFVAADSSEAAQKYELFRPWENTPPAWVTTVRYDFSSNCGRAGAPADPGNRVADYLYGSIPDQDLLVAWLCWRLDVKDEFDKLADHFAHSYCDLNGAAFADVTLYDALASTSGMDMPDTDVIAFARNILKDNSFHTPIPANAKRQALYDQIEERFSDYFRYRSSLEYAAWIYVNPDCAIRADHVALREYYWTLFAKTKDSFDAAAKEWKACKDREDFKEKVNAWRRQDGSVVKAAHTWSAARNATRGAIFAIAKDHLEARGLWSPPPANEPEANPEPPPADGGATGGGDDKDENPKENTMLNVGDQAPDFSIPDETGKLRTLGEFRGKTVVLWFYPKASTPG